MTLSCLTFFKDALDLFLVRGEERALVPCLTHSIVVAAIPIVVACFSYVERKVFLILL